MESNTRVIRFNTPTGIVSFKISPEVCIDTNTNQIYKFAVVHGKTWQVTLHSQIEDTCEAFTPCACPEINHRGFYEYNSEKDIYEKI